MKQTKKSHEKIFAKTVSMGYGWDDNQSFPRGGNSGNNGCAGVVLLTFDRRDCRKLDQFLNILIAIVGISILFVRS